MNETHQHDWQPFDADDPDGIAVCRCAENVLMWRGLRMGPPHEGRFASAPLTQYVRQTHVGEAVYYVEGRSEYQW